MADPVRPYPLSHLAVRVPEWDLYVHVRTATGPNPLPR
jgi:hypothetical protein